MNRIKQNIELLRRIYGHTQYEVSALAHIPFSTYKYRIAHPGTFKLDELERLSKVLHTNAQTLTFGEPKLI